MVIKLKHGKDGVGRLWEAARNIRLMIGAPVQIHWEVTISYYGKDEK